VDQFGFVQAVGRLGQGVVVAVARAADRGLAAGLGQPFAISDAHVLRSPIGLMGQRIVIAGMARITPAPTHRARRLSSWTAHAPADDASGVDIDDEGHIHPALPSRDVGVVRDPELIWPLRPELPVDAIQRPHGSIVGDGGAQPLGTPHALQALGAHQAFDRATVNPHAFAVQLAVVNGERVEPSLRSPELIAANRALLVDGRIAASRLPLDRKVTTTQNDV